MYIRGGGAGSDSARKATLGLYASGSKIYNLRADASDGSFQILDSSTERLRITSGGQVNIGNNLTQTTWLTHIEGAYNKAGLRVASGAPNYEDPFVVATSTGGERFRITGDGYVGIGATNPGADPAVGNDANILEIRRTTTGSITSGNNRRGAVLRLKHETQWENPYSGGDDVGRIEFATGDDSTGEGLRSVIRCEAVNYYNTNDLVFDVADYASATMKERLRITSGGELLLGGMTSPLLSSDDLQIQGSGGPAIISGYKSDNNPTYDQKMLTLRAYSQSGSTFTSIGEIDVRVDQGSNTASGYHPGSIVTRVNGGSETGTHASIAYSFAGVKDRERITHKSKRFYCLPEWDSGSTVVNTFRQQWDYQHYVGLNQYSWYKYSTHASSSSRGGSADILVTWSTRHASGSGHGRYAVYWRDRHDNSKVEIMKFYSYFENYANGTFYGWTSNPSLDVYQCDGTGNSAGFYLRLQGHINTNSGTYDGGTMQQFTINSHTNRYGSDVEQFKFVGNSTPSDVGAQLTKSNLP